MPPSLTDWLPQILQSFGGVLGSGQRFLLFIIIIGGIAAIGPNATVALFSDEQSAVGNMTADHFPPGQVAYIDNGDGTYTEVSSDDLTDFNDPSADLVIPEGVQEEYGPIDGGNGEVSIVAGSIMSKTNISSKNRDVILKATSGGIDVGGTGITVGGGSGDVDISAPGDINLTGAALTTGTRSISVSTDGVITIDDATVEVSGGSGNIDLAGMTVSGKNAEVISNTRDISISARRNGGGKLEASDIDIMVEGGNGDVLLESSGNANLEDAEIAVNSGDPEIDLGSGTPTLFVDGTEINGGTGTLYFSPSATIVNPERDDVVASN